MQLANALVEVVFRVNRSSESRARAEVQRAADAMDTEAEIDVAVDTSKLPAGVRRAQTSSDEIDRMDPDIEPEVDNAKLKDGLAESERSIEDSAREMGKMFARWFAADKVIDQINGAIRAASDLEQAIGGSQAVFGEWAHVIDEAASGSAESMGLSAEAARTLTSQIGALLKGFGWTQEEAAKTSVEIAQLGADLAATFGGRPEDAVNALGAALRGEYNPIERYGVAMNVAQINIKAVEMGLAESTAQVDLNTRAMAALALINERTADAQGQFAREADMAAGKQAILSAKWEDARAKLGGELLPIYVEAVRVVTLLVDVFSALPGPVQTALVALIGIAAVYGPVRDVTRAFGSLTTMISKLGTAGPVVIALTAAVTAAALAAQWLSQRDEELERRSAEVGKALANQADETLRVAFASEGAESAVEGLAAANRALNMALLTGDDGEKLVIALGQLGVSSDLALEALTRLGDDGKQGLLWLGEAAGLSGRELEVLAEAVNRTDKNGEDLKGTIATVAHEYGYLGTSGIALAERLWPVAAAMEEVQDQQEKTDLSKAATEYLAITAASSEYANTLIKQAEEEVGAHRAGDRSVEVYRRYAEILATQDQAMQDAILATEDQAAATNLLVVELAAADPMIRREAEALGILTYTTERAVEPVERLGRVVSNNTRKYLANEAAAKRLDTALDQVLGPTRQLSDAQDALHNAALKLNTALESNGTTLDRNTAAGQANRSAIKSGLGDIEAYGLALVRNGASADRAALAIQHNTNALEDHLVAAGMDRRAVRELIDEYGLVPDDVLTILRVEEEAYVNATIDRFNGLLDSLPHARATLIQATIDAGNFELANRYLDQAEGKVRTVDAAVLDLAAATGVYDGNLVDATADTNVFADALSDTGDSAKESERELRRFANVTNELADEADRAKRASDDLRRALDRLVNPSMDLAETTRQVAAITDELTAAMEDNSRSLATNTAEGRANQEMIDDHVTAIWAHGQAMLAAGRPIGEVSAEMSRLTQEYRDNLIAAGFAEDAVDDYLRTIASTPEGVATTFEQLGLEQGQRAVDNLNAALDKIPPLTTATVRPEIDERSVEVVAQRLVQLSQARTATINVATSISSAVAAALRALPTRAMGGYFDQPEIGIYGEAGGEFILPTTRPERMRQILAQHPAEADRVRDALGGGAAMTDNSASLSIGTLQVGRAQDLPEAISQIDRLHWRLAMGARP